MAVASAELFEVGVFIPCVKSMKSCKETVVDYEWMVVKRLLALTLPPLVMFVNRKTNLRI